jgi:peptide-N4-(N-acetyl-beta-glucosaminyl)asparagine amidase
LAEGISCFEDGLAEALVKWFKPEFFAWIDPIKCPKCDGATRMSGFVQPTSEESNGQASRVELHVCNKENGECDGQIRFPRYKCVSSVYSPPV